MVYSPQSGKKIASEIVEVADFIAIKGIKARGKRVTTFAVEQYNWLTPLQPDPEHSESPENHDYSEDSKIPDDRLGFAEGTQTQLF